MPAGFGSAGLGTPVGLPVPGGAGYQQSVDVVAAESIDPVTRDYALDDEGKHYAITATEQRVLLALSQPFGSLPWDATFGDRTLNLTKLPANAIDTVRRHTENALAHLTSTGAIELLGVVIETDPRGTLLRAVDWVDVSSRVTRNTKAPLQ
jgi:hypothetical protein